MTDTETKLLAAFRTLAYDIESARDNFLDVAAPLIIDLGWHEVKDEDGDKVCANEVELDAILSRKMPKMDAVSAEVECAGFEWYFLMEALAGAIWDIVKKKHAEALRKEWRKQ